MAASYVPVQSDEHDGFEKGRKAIGCSNSWLLLIGPCLVAAPSCFVWCSFTYFGTGGCALTEDQPYLGCGIAHYWVPVYLTMMCISLLISYAAHVNANCPDPEIPLVVLDNLKEEFVRPIPQTLRIEGSRRAAINGEYLLDKESIGVHSSQQLAHSLLKIRSSVTAPGGMMPGSTGMKWKHAESDLVISHDLTDWEICGKDTGFCAHSLRHHRGRMPHEFPAFWRCLMHIVEVKADGSLVTKEPEDSKDGTTIMDQGLKVTSVDETSGDSAQFATQMYLKFFRWVWVATAFGFALPLVLFLYFPILDVNGFTDTIIRGQDKSAFALPFDSKYSTISDGEKECGCVVIDSVSILHPFQYSFFSVLLFFTGSMISTIVSYTCSGKDRLSVCAPGKINELIWRSAVRPSRFLVALGCLSSLVNFVRLLWEESLPVVSGETPWYIAYRIIMTSFMDSGAMNIYATCLYGSFLTLTYFASEKTGATQGSDRPSLFTGAGLRVWVGYLFFTLKLLPMLTYVWLAKLKWPWIAIPVEVLLSLLMEVFIPEAAQSMHAFLVRRKRWRELTNSDAHNTFSAIGPSLQYVAAFMILPLQEIVGWFSRRYGLSSKISPLSDGYKAFAVALFILVKTLQLQYFASLQVLNEAGVGYLDAVPLAYEARHSHCDFCLFKSSIAESKAYTSSRSDSSTPDPRGFVKGSFTARRTEVNR